MGKEISEVQQSLKLLNLDGWLLYDYHHSNPIALRFLEISDEKLLSRPLFYWIPQTGDPIKIISVVEPEALNHLPGVTWMYKGWQERERLLFSIAVENSTIAMEYSPFYALPNVSKVDAGLIELIRKAGANVVSSANLLQRHTAIWTEEQVKTHFAAAEILDGIVERAWAFIERSLQMQSPIDEYLVQQFMLQAINDAACQIESSPICAVNAHAANPHYQALAKGSSVILEGDFIQLDVWCKQRIPRAVYADIARVGVTATQPTAKQQEIFNIVKSARDLATFTIKEKYANKQTLEGWEVDQICRDLIMEEGFGDYFIHRTGHNLGEEVHGPGVNLDNLETHDDRQLLPGIGFTVEPGIYLPNEFGVRLEYDLYLDPSGQVHITGGIQEEIVCLKF